MTELLLDQIERDVLLRELGREAVPKAMCVNTFLDTGLACEPWKKRTYIGRVKRRALKRAEDGFAASMTQRQPAIQPALDDRGSAFVNANGTCAVALSVKNPGGPGREIKILGEERESLGEPKPSAVQHRDERTVPDARRCISRARSKQLLDFLLGERLRR